MNRLSFLIHAIMDGVARMTATVMVRIVVTVGGMATNRLVGPLDHGCADAGHSRDNESNRQTKLGN